MTLSKSKRREYDRKRYLKNKCKKQRLKIELKNNKFSEIQKNSVDDFLDEAIKIIKPTKEFKEFIKSRKNSKIKIQENKKLFMENLNSNLIKKRKELKNIKIRLKLMSDLIKSYEETEDPTNKDKIIKTFTIPKRIYLKNVPFTIRNKV